MIENKLISKVFQKVYSIKRLNTIEKEAEKKLKSFKAKLNVPQQLMVRSKSFSKDIFTSSNSFISITSGKLNVSKLYENRILPSQYMVTSKNEIKKLTRKIYISGKPEKFTLNFPETTKNKLIRKRRRKVDPTSKAEDNTTYEGINKTCDEFLKENQAYRRQLRKRSRQVNQKYLRVKKEVQSLEKLNERNGFYMLHNLSNDRLGSLSKFDILESRSSPKKLDN